MARILAVFVLLLCQLSSADEFLVRLKSFPFGMNDFVQKVHSQGMNVMSIYQLVPGLVRINGKPSSLSYLQGLPEVMYAEVNHVRTPMITQAPDYQILSRPPIPAPVPRPTEWIKNGGDTRNFGLYQNRTKEIFEKRKFYGSEKVVIAVLDTGVDYTHRDLAANMWRNPGELGADDQGNPKESNGIDDDANGFVDDVVGWDFYHQDNLPFDDYGHGTHVAGIAAAVGGDGWGIAGQCPRCSVMALKFIGADGSGTDADAIEGLEYAAKMGATVINSSWGGDVASQALYDAFLATSKMGILNAVAAGNMGVDLAHGIPNAFPAEYQIAGMFSIAALYAVNISIPFWSNYGRPYVHFSMAGADVYSCIPGGRHAGMSGTSMAAPNAAGVLALMKSYRPNLSYAQIEEILRKVVIIDPDSMSMVNFRGRPDMVKAFELMDKIAAD